MCEKINFRCSSGIFILCYFYCDERPKVSGEKLNPLLHNFWLDNGFKKIMFYCLKIEANDV